MATTTTITCKTPVKDAKSGETRPCKNAPVKDSDFCSRHGGKATAPSAAAIASVATKPVTAAAAQAPKVDAQPAAAPQGPVGQQCTGTVKKTNLRCTNKPKVGTLCGMHAPKAAKAVPVSTDGSGYPTGCKKLTGKNEACKNAAYGPDNVGVPSCFRHGGPTKVPSAGGAAAGASSTKGAVYSGPLAGVPLIRIMTVVSEYYLSQMTPENVQANQEHGYEPEYEVCLWLAKWMKLFDGKTPSDVEVMKALLSLEETSDGENFEDNFTKESGEPMSMVAFMAEMLRQKDTEEGRPMSELMEDKRQSVMWLVEYIRRYASMAMEGADKLKILLDNLKEELELPEVLVPTQNVGDAPKAPESANYKSMMDKIKGKVLGKMQAPPAEAPKDEKAEEELLA